MEAPSCRRHSYPPSCWRRACVAVHARARAAVLAAPAAKQWLPDCWSALPPSYLQRPLLGQQRVRLAAERRSPHPRRSEGCRSVLRLSGAALGLAVTTVCILGRGATGPKHRIGKSGTEKLITISPPHWWGVCFPSWWQPCGKLSRAANHGLHGQCSCAHLSWCSPSPKQEGSRAVFVGRCPKSQWHGRMRRRVPCKVKHLHGPSEARLALLQK